MIIEVLQNINEHHMNGSRIPAVIAGGAHCYISPGKEKLQEQLYVI